MGLFVLLVVNNSDVHSSLLGNLDDFCIYTQTTSGFSRGKTVWQAMESRIVTIWQLLTDTRRLCVPTELNNNTTYVTIRQFVAAAKRLIHWHSCIAVRSNGVVLCNADYYAAAPNRRGY